jgi:hypothetical protein
MRLDLFHTLNPDARPALARKNDGELIIARRIAVRLEQIRQDVQILGGVSEPAAPIGIVRIRPNTSATLASSHFI